MVPKMATISHRQPVHPRDVAADGQLEDQGGGESDGPEANSDVWVDLECTEISPTSPRPWRSSVP